MATKQEIDAKQGSENADFVKEEHEQHDNYILQKNTKTKTATYIIIAFLVVLVLGIVVSALFFGSPEA
ncbi:hypothetical protein B0O79_0917 [Flavobacteriaceae bacterium MAR_2009_75]|nr:hypothetical protein B0O79_0917 [Flavobacteriaceae bacterium MAR_2009_75]